MLPGALHDDVRRLPRSAVLLRLAVGPRPPSPLAASRGSPTAARAPAPCTTRASAPPPPACRKPTICPPPAPPSGPMSMTQSAVLITSRLCSTTSTVLPASTKPCSTVEQQLDVGEVQAGRRLVEQVQRPAGRLLHQLAGQLDPLRLAAGKRRRRLADLDVVEPHRVERAELVRGSVGCSRSAPAPAARPSRAPGRCSSRGTSPAASRG